MLVIVCIALASRFIHGAIPNAMVTRTISEILIALLLGLLIRNAMRLPAQIELGAKFALTRVLRLGIILLGLRLSLQDVAATGISALLLVAACITLALALAFVAGRAFNIPPRLAALIGVGTAICGNSAIVATAPVIDAREDEVSFAVAIITLFGLLAVIFYPIIGHTLALTERAFGMWAGVAVNDTSQVVAVGAAYSPLALNVATVVKLTRNTLIAPLIVLIGLVYQRGQTKSRAVFSWSKLIPWFVLGFLALTLARTVGVAFGVLPQNVDRPGDLQSAASALKFFDEVAKFAILTALTGVGLSTDIRNILKIGLGPFIVGLCIAAVLAVASLSLIVASGL